METTGTLIHLHQFNIIRVSLCPIFQFTPHLSHEEESTYGCAHDEFLRKESLSTAGTFDAEYSVVVNFAVEFCIAEVARVGEGGMTATTSETLLVPVGVTDLQ
jgi:hypothetical protein